MQFDTPYRNIENKLVHNAHTRDERLLHLYGQHILENPEDLRKNCSNWHVDVQTLGPYKTHVACMCSF